MKKKIIIARARVKAGREGAFIAAAKKLAEASRAEEGNVSYTFYQSIQEPEAFIFYEEYKDDAAVQAHASSAAFKAFSEAIKELTEGDLIVDKF